MLSINVTKPMTVSPRFAAILKCATIEALARLLGREYLPLNPANGVESPPLVAWIDEQRCIGCARCLPPCPVDAIVGASKYLHTVIVERCTGCELCFAPCPVDCIEMRPGPAPAVNQAAVNRERFEAHEARAARRAGARREQLETMKAAAPRASVPSS